MRLVPEWALIQLNCDPIQKIAADFTFEGLGKGQVVVFSLPSPYAINITNFKKPHLILIRVELAHTHPNIVLEIHEEFVVTCSSGEMVFLAARQSKLVALLASPT